MITYGTPALGKTPVLLEGKTVGNIVVIDANDKLGFQYVPVGQNIGGAVYASMSDCKNSLNNE